MSLTCDAYTDQTLSTTLCQIASNQPCNEGFTIEPPLAVGLAIDALARKLNINLLTVPPVDLLDVIQNANCALKGQEGFQTITPLQTQAFLLYLVNQIVCG